LAQTADETRQEANEARETAASRLSATAASEKPVGAVFPARLHPVVFRFVMRPHGGRFYPADVFVDGERREHDDDECYVGDVDAALCPETVGSVVGSQVAQLQQPEHRQHGGSQDGGQRDFAKRREAGLELVAAVQPRLTPDHRVLAILLEEVVFLLADDFLGPQRRVVVGVAVVVREAIEAAADHPGHAAVFVLFLDDFGARAAVVADRVADDGDAIRALPGDDSVMPVPERTMKPDVVPAHQHGRVCDPLEVELGLTAGGGQVLATHEALDGGNEAHFVDVLDAHLVGVIVAAVGAERAVDGVTSQNGNDAVQDDGYLALTKIAAAQPASVAHLKLRTGTD